MVSLVTSRNRVQSNNNTFNCKCIATLSCHVIFVCRRLEFRNEEIESVSSFYIVCVYYLSCYSICNILFMINISIYVNCNCIRISFFSGNSNKCYILSIRLNSPRYCNVALHHNGGKSLNVAGSTVLFVLFVIIFKQCDCVICLCFSYSGSFLAGIDDTINKFLNLINNTTNGALNLITGSESSKAHNECQNKN